MGRKSNMITPEAGILTPTLITTVSYREDPALNQQKKYAGSVIEPKKLR